MYVCRVLKVDESLGIHVQSIRTRTVSPLGSGPLETGECLFCWWNENDEHNVWLILPMKRPDCISHPAYHLTVAFVSFHG